MSTKQEYIKRLEAELERLKGWIKDTASDYDICTYDLLNEICSSCRCVRGMSEQDGFDRWKYNKTNVKRNYNSCN